MKRHRKALSGGLALVSALCATVVAGIDAVALDLGAIVWGFFAFWHWREWVFKLNPEMRIIHCLKEIDGMDADELKQARETLERKRAAL